MMAITEGQTRAVRAAPIIEPEVDNGGFVARVVTYGVEDEYGTYWGPGVFAASLAARTVPLAWGHSWIEPIGRAVEWWERDEGLDVEFELDDPEAVPRARQARAQVRSGTIRDVSVGFTELRSVVDNNDDTFTFTEAHLDEVSLVLRGAVPGAHVNPATVRQLAQAVEQVEQVPARKVARLLRALAAGEITTAEALAEAGVETTLPPPLPDTAAALRTLRRRGLRR